MATRKQKMDLYEQQFGHIPKDFDERLSYMYDEYKLNEKKAQAIIEARNRKLNDLIFHHIKLVLYEVPEGAKRPRARVTRTNFPSMAIANPSMIHIYSPNAKEDNLYMRRLMDDEIIQLNQLINTPIMVHYNTFLKTPSSWNTETTFLSEIGLDRPITAPDWDNIGKKYSDMTNANIWLDDAFVIRGIVDKYCSILPRIEIDIYYLNMLYNRYQYNQVIRRKEFIESNGNVDYWK
jgi:Holliday junction resolvase RusA-like endonuclease